MGKGKKKGDGFEEERVEPTKKELRKVRRHLLEEVEENRIRGSVFCVTRMLPLVFRCIRVQCER